MIPSFKAPDLLSDLFTSFLATNIYSDVEFVVVTQGSGPQTTETINRFASKLNIHQLDNGVNESFSVACNKGAKISSGDIVLFCNNDVIFRSDILSSLTKTFSDEAIGIVGAVQKSRDLHLGTETTWHVGIGMTWNSGARSLRPVNIPFGVHSPLPKGLYQAWAVNGGFLAMKRLTFELLGGFSPEFDFGYEDVDLCLRCWRDLDLLVVTNTELEVFHEESTTRAKVDPDLLDERNRRNTEALRRRVGDFIESDFLKNKFTTSGSKLDWVPRVAFQVSSLPTHNKAHGDPLVAASLAKWLHRNFGWHCNLAAPEQWVASYQDADVVITMTPSIQIRETDMSPFVLKVAWMRNRLDEWAMLEGVDDFDSLLVTSQAGKNYFELQTPLNCEVFRLAVDHELFPQTLPDKHRSVDVLLTQNYWHSQRDVFGWNLGDSELKGVVLGRGWDSSSAPDKLRMCWQGLVPYRSLSGHYRSASLVVDDSTSTTKPWGQVNMRVFEAIQSGALVVSNDRIGISELFGDELLCWTSVEDLDLIVKETLSQYEQRRSLVAKLQTKIEQEHTYELRASEFHSILARVLSAPIASGDALP